MRLPLLLCLSAAASACAGSAPAVEAPRPRPVAVRLPPRPPAPVAVVPEAAPAPPPAAPRGTVASRSHYAEADVTEWILSNGATVVFKPLPTPGRLAVRASVRPATSGARQNGWEGATLEEASDLRGAFETLLAGLQTSEPDGVTLRRAALDRATFVVVGDAAPAAVEAAAARVLVAEGTTGQVSSTSGMQTGYRVPAPPDADAAVAVLVEVLNERAGRPERAVQAFRDAWTGTTTLKNVPDAGALAGLRPTAAELSAARDAVARTAPASAAFWADALMDLYGAPGETRPARDPAFVARFASRAARVSAQAVTDLAARFAASPFTD